MAESADSTAAPATDTEYLRCFPHCSRRLRHHPGADPHHARDSRAQPRLGRSCCCSAIPTRGVHLASRIAKRMSEVEGRTITAGALDVTMYRDDLRLRPARSLEHTDIPDDVDDKIVVLIDDVLFSGRTIRAALDALNDIGRPRAVQLAVLVDRGHRELPIRADFVGKNLPTSLPRRCGFGSPRPTTPTGVTIVGRWRLHEAPAERRRPDSRRSAPHPRHRRRAAGSRPAADQEAADAARPDGRQPVLRGLHPHPHLLRGGRQAAQRRRHQLLGQGLERVQGREPQGHRA